MLLSTKKINYYYLINKVSLNCLMIAFESNSWHAWRFLPFTQK